MQLEISRKRFTVDDYYRMAEVGILRADDRVELINGEIIQMSPPGLRHMAASHRAVTVFTEALGRRVIVSVQNPLPLNQFSEPQPDIILLKPRPDFYASSIAAPEDALLVIEISDTSLPLDRGLKVPSYAANNILELWIEDLKNNALLVYRDPAGPTYKTMMSLKTGDTIAPIAFPNVNFRVEDLLP